MLKLEDVVFSYEKGTKIIKLNITKFIINTVFSFVINRNTSTPADKINFSRGLTSLRELA